ncbi:hypothetical protein OHC33_011021 [Knufia fluminis]|uniref:Uncharacterized protein n=1 Tax=Knufia fluminis TaxID=191047 RepID=A0AAN8E8Z4_9EURO|nr:hypothetical protein OHC33_011021 [Knufia fluminis]
MVMSIKKTTYITSLPPWQPSQQPADKSASRLLQLPDEIKVLILEPLLISPEGVNGDKHPSILGTCQDMLNIGQPILYSQTERVLFFCYGGAGVLSFLQGPHRPITYRPSYFEASYNLDQRDMLRDITAGPLDEIILSHLSKFTHIRLQVKTSDSVGLVGSYDQAALYELVHRCREALSGKHIVVEIYNYTEWKPQISDSVNVAIRAFSTLRCNHIEFHHTTANEAQTISHVAELVQGDAEVQDLYSLYRPLKAQAKQIPKDYQYRRTIENHLMVMLDGVKTLDKDVVEREQRLVQRYLDYWRHREPVQHKEPVQPGDGGSAQHMQDNRTMLDRNRKPRGNGGPSSR